MLATFGSRPSTKVDRLAAIRSAKAAIQNGQGQQQQWSESVGSSHPLPPRPSLAQVPRSTVGMNVDWPMAPMGGSGGGSPDGGGGASGSGGGGRK